MTPEEFLQIWQATAEPAPIFYRLYYNEQGHPLFYSMEDKPGNYIDIDQETYSRSPRNIRVRNGKIVYITQSSTQKLIPNTTGTACDPRDVCVIIDQEPCTKWSLKTYEPN